jgi:Ca2+-binding RTX toxin-like protein
LEYLQDRVLPTITYDFINGNLLEIMGDANGNLIALTADGNGDILGGGVRLYNPGVCTLNSVQTIEIWGLDGNDTISINLTGSTAPAFIYGGSGNDSILGGAGDDTLIGYIGNDYIEGSSGNDKINDDFDLESVR